MNLYLSLVMTFQMQLQRWALEFDIWLSSPPTHPLRPINPDNAWGLCITAAAGTELATSYSQGTVNQRSALEFSILNFQFSNNFQWQNFKIKKFNHLDLIWNLKFRLWNSQCEALASSLAKGVYNPKAFILHAASLGQAFAHCRIFLTAASRRSLGSVSVPVRRVVLSHPLPVIALVGYYLTN